MAWMGVIFILSSQGGLGRAVHAGDLVKDILAKLGHVLEYGVLALLARNVLAREGASRRRAALWAILFAALYGASDEWHQSFVPGREARITDVMIDAVGAALAIRFIQYLESRPNARRIKDEGASYDV